MIGFSFLGGSNISIDSGKLYSDSVEVGDGESSLRPLHATEINKKLKTRDWNVYPRKYIKDGELYLAREQAGSPILVVDSMTKGVKQSHQVGEYTNEFITGFLRSYKDIIDEMNKKGEIYIHDSSKRTIDLLKSSVLINVVREDSNLYTTTADLGDIVVTGFDGKIDLSLRYTKGDGKIYNYSTVLVTSVDTSTGNSDVEVEYKGRVLSAFPKNKDVNECIINSLQVTYGLL